VLAGQPRGSAECATWARFISALLKAASWPGDAELTPLEQAAADQWRELLSTLGSLGLTSGAVSWREALRLLKELTSVDGPVSGDLQSPVQVLDPIDATSIQFDRAWAVGLSHGEWPKLSPSTPFIPPVLQRLSQMPSMPDGRERESARAIDALHQSARSVFGSFSAEGGRTHSLSARIKDFVLRETDEIPLWSGKAVLDRIRPVALEEVDDTHGPVYRIQGKALGGSYLIRSQSACPFRAFTESRLHAREWDEGVFAFDHRDRGKFIHQAFAMFWQQVRDSETLHQLSPTELSSLIETVAERALAGDREFTVFRDQLRKAEQERIGRILHAWVEIEKKRTVPFTVHQVEAEYNVSFAGLPFQVRIDRIDELRNGGLVVIDYKSGSPQQKGLDGERPKEPQLLVYAAALAASGADVEGIYFGKLQARDEQAIGYARRLNFGGKKETVKSDWNDQLRTWTQLVHGLAEEFVNGYALTMPDSKVCKFCAIKPVCRMTEASRLSTADGESE
jgi:probable DNA repair protein